MPRLNYNRYWILSFITIPYFEYLIEPSKGIPVAGSTVSFSDLKSRVDKNSHREQVSSKTTHLAFPTSNRSFENPLFLNPPVIHCNTSPTQANKQVCSLEPTLLSPIPKSSSGSSLKSNKSAKSLRSFFGFSTESTTERPSVDLSVDISMEASKMDSLSIKNDDMQQHDDDISNINMEGTLVTFLTSTPSSWTKWYSFYMFKVVYCPIFKI